MISLGVFKRIRRTLLALYGNNITHLSILVDDAGLDQCSINFNQISRVVCYQIIEEAQKHNKVSNLLDLACEEYSGNVEIRVVKNTYSQLCKLAALLKNYHFSYAQLSAFCVKCLSPNTSFPTTMQQDVLHLVDFLWDLEPQFPKTYKPIFEFVGMVEASQKNTEFHQSLTNWKIETQRLLELSDKDVWINLPINQPGVSPIICVTIEIGCNWIIRDQKRFSLIIDLWDKSTHKKQLYSHYEQNLTLTQIEEKWNEVFHNVETTRWLPKETQNIHLEFIVPNALLSVEFDRWQIKSKYYGDTYGMRYITTVRSLERAQKLISDPDVYKLWSDRVELTQRVNCHFEHVEHTQWVQQNAPDATGRRAYLNWRRSQHFLCLKLTYRPTDNLARSDSVQPWLDAGIPIAVWCRDTNILNRYSIDQLRDKIVALIGSDTCLLDLPHRFREIRSDAFDDPDSEEKQLGTHLVLFWEDMARHRTHDESLPLFWAP